MSGASRTKQSKTVTLIYGGISAVLLLVIAALALVFVPPSPPSVAEFAPQAQDAIEQAPDQQSSRFGGGAGGACALGQKCDDETSSQLPATKRAVIDRARVRRCVGNPPRQIEDPQSPPCVQFFEGNNGGTTWKGVTRDEIRVALPTCSAAFANCGDLTQKIAAFFNRRFEFYGRSLTVRGLGLSGAFAETDQTQRAAAQKADEELGSFASLHYAAHLGADSPYYDELARRKILSIGSNNSMRTEQEDYSPQRPYQWNVRPAFDQTQVNLGEWMCKWLVGRNAEYGGPDVSGQRRKFGVLAQRESAGTPTTSFLAAELGKCSTGVSIAEFTANQSDLEMRAILGSFQQSRVTTIACFCAQFEKPMGSADSLGYHPEWLVSAGPSQGEDQNPKGGNWPLSQRSQMFGINNQSRWNSIGDSPWWWAISEADPSFDAAQVSGASGHAALGMRPVYEALLLLSSGIQMAGPNLNPSTFEKGLAETAFPNPGAGGPPYYQARVDFGYNDHTMTNDFGLFWWSETAPSYSSSTPTGGFCYVGRGLRFQQGAWPETPMSFFDHATCR